MSDIEPYKRQVEEAVAFLAARIARRPRLAVVLGTGLGALVDRIEEAVWLAYDEIPHFPKATVPSHAGNLVCGRLHGQSVAVLQGRFHFYEGYSTKALTLPIRVLALLGAEVLIITNAAGGLNPSFEPGTIMLIRDHLHLLGENPLRGPNYDEWGPRFPDLAEPYDRTLLGKALQCAKRLKIPRVTSGVYVSVPGPSLETPAETRYLRSCGADAVGMSTTPEVIVGKHAAMRILGLSVIANVNDPDNFRPVKIDEVIKTSQATAPRLVELLAAFLKEL